MAAKRLIDLNGDDISIASDHERDFDQESLSELELLDFSHPAGSASSGAAQVAKALEIAEERNTSWDEHLAETSVGVGEGSSRTPEPAAAPPAYSAAIASDGPPPAIETGWTDRMPQSMSDTGLLSQDRVERGDVYGSPEHDLLKELGHVTRQLWRIFTEYVQSVQKKRGRKFGLTKRAVRFIVAALTFVILLAIFLPIIIRAIINHRRDVAWEKEMHPYSEHPAYKRDPHKDHPDTAECTFEVFSDYEEGSDTYLRRNYRYDPYAAEGEVSYLDRSFGLFEELDTGLPADFINPTISGRVEIISIPPRPQWEEPEITMRTHVATNRPWKADGVFVDRNIADDTFTLRTPTLTKSNGVQPAASGHSCLDVWVGIYIPVNIGIANWTTVLRSLDFVDSRGYVFDPSSRFIEADQVAKGAIRVENTTTIKLNRGSIDISYWNSLQTNLETRGGDIRGKYAFHKALNLKTLGGAVDIQVDPQDLPTGALSAKDGDALTFSTTTGSGNTNITVRHPSDPDWTPHFMESTHRTTTGSLQLHYPPEWAGTIDGITTSSHVEIKGQDVRKNDAVLDTPGEIHMTKGNRAAARWGPLGQLYVESETGNIDVVIGDV